jgi:spermidine synthase
MKSAGLSVVPYHDNVPSFGEWGWWIGGRNDRQSETFLTKRLSAIPALTVKTKYLSSHLIKASLHFGINQLETSETAINTITNPRIHNYYLDAWQESH